jgi:hypothetical protein
MTSFANDDIFAAAARGDLHSVQHFVQQDRVLDRTTDARPEDIPVQWRDMFVETARSAATARGPCMRTTADDAADAAGVRAAASAAFRRTWREPESAELLHVQRTGGAPAYVSKRGARYDDELVDYEEPRQVALVASGAMRYSSGSRARRHAAANQQQEGGGADGTAGIVPELALDRALMQPMPPTSILGVTHGDSSGGGGGGGGGGMGFDTFGMTEEDIVAATKARDAAKAQGVAAAVARARSRVGARTESSLAVARGAAPALQKLVDPQHDDVEVFDELRLAKQLLRDAEHRMAAALEALRAEEEAGRRAHALVLEMEARKVVAAAQEGAERAGLAKLRAQIATSLGNAEHETDKHQVLAYLHRAELLEVKAAEAEVRLDASALTLLECDGAIAGSQSREVERHSRLMLARYELGGARAELAQRRAELHGVRERAEMHLSNGMHIRAPSCVRGAEDAVGTMRAALRAGFGTAPTALKSLAGRRFDARPGTRVVQSIATGELHRLGLLRKVLRAWVRAAHGANKRRIERIAHARYNVILRTSLGRTIPLKCHSTNTGAEIKAILQRRFGYGAASVTLATRGVEIGDRQTLVTHGVPNNGIVSVILSK